MKWSDFNLKPKIKTRTKEYYTKLLPMFFEISFIDYFIYTYDNFFI